MKIAARSGATACATTMFANQRLPTPRRDDIVNPLLRPDMVSCRHGAWRSRDSSRSLHSAFYIGLVKGD